MHLTGAYRSSLYLGNVLGQFCWHILTLSKVYFTSLLECVSSDIRMYQNIYFIVLFFFLNSQGTDKKVCHDPSGIGSRNSVVIFFSITVKLFST